MAQTHAQRREPDAPSGPVALASIAEELLEEASRMSSGRAARTLTPGAHAPLKQTLIALRAGEELSDHRTNGSATIYLLRGAATLNAGSGSVALTHGQWAVIPEQRHALSASEDTVALITVSLA